MNPKLRPAEWTALAGAVAAIVARALGVTDPNTITAIAAAIGAIPGVVTFIVSLRRKGAKTSASAGKAAQ